MFLVYFSCSCFFFNLFNYFFFDLYFQQLFDLDEVERDLHRLQKKGGIEAAIKKRYRDRKAEAKRELVKFGDDRARARAMRRL